MRFNRRAGPLLSLAFLMAATLIASWANAAAITFSNGGSYGDCTFTCVQRLQQDYGAGAFGGSPVNITGVEFFVNGLSGTANNYTVTLAINPSGPNLSSTFANNLALDTQTFSTMSIGPYSGVETIDFTGSYIYNPSLGDLVVDVQCTDDNCARNPSGSFLQTSDVNRAFDFCSNVTAGGCSGGVNNGYGIATTFITGTVPEPASLALFVAGLTGLGVVRRRGRRNHGDTIHNSPTITNNHGDTIHNSPRFRLPTTGRFRKASSHPTLVVELSEK